MKTSLLSKIKRVTILNASVITLLCVFGVIASVSTASAANVTCEGVAGLNNGADCAAGTGQATEIAGSNGIFKTIVNILLFIVGAVAVIMLVIGGLRYVTSNGDQNAVTGAKNTILYAIIGIVVAFLAYAAVNFVIDQLGKNGSVVQ